MKQCWLLIHQNDHDDADDHHNLIGSFKSYELAKAAMFQREKGAADVSEETGNATHSSFWYGNDHYWLVRLW